VESPLVCIKNIGKFVGDIVSGVV